jgi:hypothetical protein
MGMFILEREDDFLLNNRFGGYGVLTPPTDARKQQENDGDNFSGHGNNF